MISILKIVICSAQCYEMIITWVLSVLTDVVAMSPVSVRQQITKHYYRKIVAAETFIKLKICGSNLTRFLHPLRTIRILMLNFQHFFFHFEYLPYIPVSVLSVGNDWRSSSHIKAQYICRRYSIEDREGQQTPWAMSLLWTPAWDLIMRQWGTLENFSHPDNCTARISYRPHQASNTRKD